MARSASEYSEKSHIQQLKMLTRVDIFELAVKSKQCIESC